ncbi:TRAP transporter small permease [Xanthobacter tagetidis]|jgi:TRAP-type C4-dicarboxylate transport system permease small subunit|uniref:TRAP transporter small permease protein n=1 Tax=Xanthobacter tagetidis TaxID=60216 RepID=A0A3L7APY3_9HYPH|nr:TRAP transporter small permease [Xanthobacter tagetidis]MBB6307828.1 TRAP-type C4-dicarboxylate transport system permease small subunit [Xanthobacter tagetidis]RLP81492.1 TRAP transporter small permease [Xanthobacter tagetidis]
MIRRLLDGLYLAAGWLAGLFLISIFVLMMLLSIGRIVGFNIPSGDDFVAWAMAASAFLGLAHTFRSGELIRVGLVTDRLRGRAKRVVELGCLVIGTLTVGYFAWNAVILNWDSYRFDDISQGVVAVPLWLPQLGYSVGLVMLAIAFADELVHALRGGEPRYEKPPPASAEEVVERAMQSGV